VGLTNNKENPVYHFTVAGVQQGPLGESELRARIARGELKATDLCWQPGWPEWRRFAAVFPDAFAAPGGPPPLPAAGGARPLPRPKTSGLAVTSLVCGICTIVIFPLFFLFMVPAIVCGHVAYSKIKGSQGTLGGQGAALAGLIMGYLGIVMVPIIGLTAAMAIPAFQQVRHTAIQKTMDNDARQIASAAQQYFLENNATSVAFSYDRTTGAVGGPLSSYVRTIARDYTVTSTRLAVDRDFQLAHPALGPPRTYDPEGKRR
jgi:hypothetical protein